MRGVEGRLRVGETKRHHSVILKNWRNVKIAGKFFVVHEEKYSLTNQMRRSSRSVGAQV